ncbi:MAG: iron export ABC transporter permease subunit FetB [Spirochaetales bacterium]|nr:iron export ABC transporter permease subunit FetB [Spirochaetales bacterium]
MEGLQEGFVRIELVYLGLGYLLIVLLLVLVRLKKLGKGWEITLASLRMTVQLIAVGFVLTYVFSWHRLWITVLIFLVMEGFAIYTVFGRVKKEIFPALRPVIALSMLAGTAGALAYFLFVIVRVRPWFDPRYFIPVAGMIIGNSMNGVVIGIERLSSGMRSQLERLEGALMLGASPREAARPFVKEAFSAGIMPIVNNMMGMGIVFLPGMMTGQILSGIAPLEAIKYQIAIMLGIAGSVAVSVFLATEFGHRRFFNRHSQVRPEVTALKS